MPKYFLLLFLLFFNLDLIAQVVVIQPTDATADQEIKVIFDATQGDGNLVGASKIYMHSGVVTASPDGTEWNYVIGNWGEDDGVGEMTRVAGETDIWEITLSPTAREYYGVPVGTNIFRLAMVFRNADGSIKGSETPGTYDWGFVASNGDIYIDLNVEDFVLIDEPVDNEIYLEQGASFTISAKASSEVSSFSISIDDGSGFVEIASETSGTTISTTYTPTQTDSLRIKATATIGGQEEEAVKDIYVASRPAVNVAELPAGIIKGINYHEADPTSVTLVLEAPGKEFVYAVGDFSNWQAKDEFFMNKTPDGELFWITISGLTPGQEYVFQYWVEGNVKVGDPYAAKVADPYNDEFIPASVHPDIPIYIKKDFGIATTFETGQAEYVWAASEDTWQKPTKEDLIIYELLVRDFLGSHHYADLTDTLSYLKSLGVNAIELMPIMEFEGNISWGYNPSYFFAPDKYYGTKNELKRFIEAAHQNGIAVILDMVLNHAFSQNAMVRMYWDETNGIPSADNPWFNQHATHPFNVGYDFNHESQYTKDFVDSVNSYWIEEYHFDGYRFDLSKGFTQTNNPDDVGAWGQYDQSRIDLLTRMANELWKTDPNAYVILEHFAEGSEESVLAAEGMLLWRNMNHSYWNALSGITDHSFAGANSTDYVSYMESHDEERTMVETYQHGLSKDSYVTRDTAIALERLKMNAAFFFMLPGPKMVWQFSELGYDVSINFIDRLAEKPLPWGEGSLGYYQDSLRQHVYSVFSEIINLRLDHKDLINNSTYSTKLTGAQRRIVIDNANTDFVIIGNFDVASGAIDPQFTHTGIWYDYFSGEQVDITNVNEQISLQPGEFHIYMDAQLSTGFDQLVEVYQNPVTIEPAQFMVNETIRIIFDASKANAAGTAGLTGAQKVYMHSGVVTDDPSGKNLGFVKGNLVDDGVGEMIQIAGEDNKWEININPKEYFGLPDDTTAFRIGMYFRDADNTNLGKGFRGQDIYFDIMQEGQLITVVPAEFGKDTEITIIYDTRFGNKGLMNADKVYMHSGVVLEDKATPTGNDWAKVVGNWGADDGVGEMTRVAGSQYQWQVTLTPSVYYNLTASQKAFWLAMVFRNATGSAKGTGTPGEISNGFVAENGDIYIDVPVTEQVTGINISGNESMMVYPNPANDYIVINGIKEAGQFEIVDLIGRSILKGTITIGSNRLSLRGLDEGIYILIISDRYGKNSTKIFVESKSH